MRVLVFGADGQLGRELRGIAQVRSVDLVGLARVDADITQAADVARAIAHHAPAVVINAAAYTAVDRAEDEPATASAVNGKAPGTIAAACAASRIPLLHISTDYVFDGSKAGAYTEADPVAPLGSYGRSKEEGERAVRASLDRHIIVRTSWVYGVHGSNFLATMLRLAGERDVLRVVADQRGCPTATADLAEGLLVAAERAAAGDPVWGTYHLAGRGVTTWHAFASAIIDCGACYTGRRPTVQPIATAEFATKAKRPANSELDSSRFAQTFGFVAAPWRERVVDVVARLLAAKQEAVR
jgi:dTDP-4-dehydrorhamnose reductase